jgi:hypothetical protein
MFVGADDGLLYRLYFGRVFTGSDQELEIGLTTEEESSADGDQADKTEKPADAADEDSAEKKEDATTDEAKQDEAGSKPGRYVFVRVNFDPSLLGETLQEPVEPQESEELKALAEKVKQQASGAEPTSDDSAKGDAATDPAQPADEEANAETDAQKLQRMQEEFEAAKVEYRTQRAAYDDYQQKLKDGQQKADELNRRFAAWYYVIPGESYDKLSLDREDLIKSKEAATEVSPADGQTSDALLPQIGELSDAVMKDAAESPSIPLAPATGETPANAEPAKEATPAPETPAPETPAPETPAPETPAPETPAPETPAPETPAPDDVGDTP